MTGTLISSSEKKYFFDTYAIIEVIKNNPSYQKYMEEDLLTGVLNYAEFYYWYLKNKEKAQSIGWFRKIRDELLKLEVRDVIEGMKIRFENIKRKLSFVDCVGYAMARRRNLLFLTGDPGFRGMPDVEFVSKS